jgi:hypothetical protein
VTKMHGHDFLCYNMIRMRDGVIFCDKLQFVKSRDCSGWQEVHSCIALDNVWLNLSMSDYIPPE